MTFSLPSQSRNWFITFYHGFTAMPAKRARNWCAKRAENSAKSLLLAGIAEIDWLAGLVRFRGLIILGFGLASLARALAPLRDHPLVEDLRTGSGFMAGVQLRPEVSADQVAIACTEAGVLMRLIHNNTLHISPPFVVTDDEVALIATTITSALDGLL